MDATYHFYMIRNIGGIDYEIQDIVDGEVTTQGFVERMFDVAINIVDKPTS